jgi:hypothetical protein
MPVTTLKTQAQVKRAKIFNALNNGLSLLPKTCLKKVDETRVFAIENEQQFVPDFWLEWCETKQQYRVYILVADRDRPEKRNAGYTICTIGSVFAAMGFGVLYGFLHKHRANNKEAAYASS